MLINIVLLNPNFKKGASMKKAYRIAGYTLGGMLTAVTVAIIGYAAWVMYQLHHLNFPWQP